MEKFNIPVCLFTYQRKDTIERIIAVLKEANVGKLYLRSDEGKDENSREKVKEVREYLETAIDWDCEVIKDYAVENRGVYKNIGLGAIEILKKEKWCIFIEDDNLPDVTFFPYCEELLKKYENDEKVFMICGTNYAEKTNFDKNSYYFVKALLPCGWASWSNKFEKYYNKELDDFDKKETRKQFLKKYKNKALGKQQLSMIVDERERFVKENRFASWDFHLIATLMQNDFVAISPKVNLIRNIGIDLLGTHTKHDKKISTMTKRFCEIPTHNIEFPLIHPLSYEINTKYQKYCDKTILVPFGYRVKRQLVKIKRAILRKHGNSRK